MRKIVKSASAVQHSRTRIGSKKSWRGPVRSDLLLWKSSAVKRLMEKVSERDPGRQQYPGIRRLFDQIGAKRALAVVLGTFALGLFSLFGHWPCGGGP